MHAGFWWVNLKIESLERPRHRGEDNVIMYHKEIGWEYMDWINPAQI